eukprot:2770674-Amphidinium_carterae.1
MRGFMCAYFDIVEEEQKDAAYTSTLASISRLLASLTNWTKTIRKVPPNDHPNTWTLNLTIHDTSLWRGPLFFAVP